MLNFNKLKNSIAMKKQKFTGAYLLPEERAVIKHRLSALFFTKEAD